MITIESAPFGIDAPVIILHASPFFNNLLSVFPAWFVPIILNFESCLQSSNFTAQPSIDELSNRGLSTFDTKSIASILFAASSRGTDSIVFLIGTLQAISIAVSTETPISMFIEKRKLLKFSSFG